MTQSKAIDFAREYLWNESCFKDHERCPQSMGGKNVLLAGEMEEYDIHRSLRFRLCQSYKRLEATFGDEVTRKDIAQIVEAWILAVEAAGTKEWAQSQGETSYHPKGECYERPVYRHPLVHRNEPMVLRPPESK